MLYETRKVIFKRLNRTGIFYQFWALQIFKNHYFGFTFESDQISSWQEINFFAAKRMWKWHTGYYNNRYDQFLVGNKRFPKDR